MERMLEVSARLAESGLVHEVDINDNPMARARLSALMAAVTIERVVGIETIPHVTPRDASIMGLQSQLSARTRRACGTSSPSQATRRTWATIPGASGVYELDAIGLTGLLTRLNGGEDYSGKAIDAPTAFYIGVAVNPSADDLDTELERFRQKLDAGARFAMTQALFDISYLDRFVERLGGEMPIPFLLGVWPLSSYQLAVQAPQRGPRDHRSRRSPASARRRGRGRPPGWLRAGPSAPGGSSLARSRDLRHPALQGARGGP